MLSMRSLYNGRISSRHGVNNVAVNARGRQRQLRAPVHLVDWNFPCETRGACGDPQHEALYWVTRTNERRGRAPPWRDAFSARLP